ncbi:hypothetical protein ABH920_006109 [Catenulispora sp. EB89]|uniref:TNT domain-containing protein n=1 Tax=Catenulispora sp. EB89 TaxID=3156257 RepID=UPI0035193555
MRRTLLALVLAAVGFAAAAVPAAAAASTSAASTAGASVASVANLAESCSSDFFDGDPRLGPNTLPVWGPVGFELIGYRRTGNLPASQFLATYYNPAANGGSGGWNYPPDNGYVIAPNGQPLEFQLTVSPGTDMDRFGSEYGSFLAPAGLPYAARSIPPQSLDSNPAATCNYHDYQVLKPFTVDAGPIAAWFAQPGGGLQYQLDSKLVPGAPTQLNVMWLVNNGYLGRIG